MDDINSIVVFDSKGAEPAAAEPVQPTGEAAPVATATPAEPAKQERDEAGKFKAREQAQPETPEPQAAQPTATTEPAKPDGRMAALLAERGKRQEAEQRLAQMQARIAALESGQSVEADPVREQVQREVAPIRAAFFQQSIELAGSAHTDFEEVAEQFSQMVESDPALHQRWLASENPGEFAYSHGSSAPQFREKRERTYKETITAKDTEIGSLKARVAELEASSKKLSELPESLNRQPSGAVPVRQDDQYDIRNIVRFK